MASNSAADQINAVFQRVQNIADAQITNAGGYANQAIAATDNIRYDEGTGAIIPPVLSPLVQVPEATPPPSGSTSATGEAANITASLQQGLVDFFNTYFPDTQGEHASAVEGLQRLAAATDAGLIALQARLGNDREAIDYARRRFDTTRADQAVNAAMDGGVSAASYLLDRYDISNQAVTYLLTKFEAGDTATQQLMQMLTSGTGIPTTVEMQLWQRDRSRVIMDAQRAVEESTDSWASRGYPLPPGAAASARLTIQRDTQSKIAESSRDKAIKQADIIIGNIKFAAEQAVQDAAQAGKLFVDDGAGAARVSIDAATAATRLKYEDAQTAARILIDDARQMVTTYVEVGARAAEQLIGLRSDAIRASLDYMRALAIGPQLAVEIEKTRAQIQATLAEVAVRYYSAEVQAADSYNRSVIGLGDITTRIAIASADNKTRLHMAKGSTDVGIAEAKSRAASAAAQAAGNSAASALSALNAIASLTSSS